MDQFGRIGDAFINAADEFFQNVGNATAQLLGAALLLIAGGVAGALLASLSKKALRFAGVEKVEKNRAVAAFFKKADLKPKIIDTIGKIVFWLVIVVFAMVAADVLGLNAMRDVIREILAYLPNVLAAVIVLTVTIAGGRVVRGLVTASLKQFHKRYAEWIGSVTYTVLIVFGSVLALDQLGFNTTILVANLTAIVVGVVGALALAFGLGGREYAANLLAYPTVKSIYKEGQAVSVAGHKGKISRIGPTAVTLETHDGEVAVKNTSFLS